MLFSVSVAFVLPEKKDRQRQIMLKAFLKTWALKLICVTIFMQSNVNCAQLISLSETMNNYKAAGYIADCLRDSVSYQSLFLLPNLKV